MIAEVETNILSCYKGLNANDYNWESTGMQSNASNAIVHQVIMLDELATEHRLQWDDSTDKFQGSCWEHNHKVSLTFSSEKELDLMCDALQNNEVHLASEVCIIHSQDIFSQRADAIHITGNSCCSWLTF